MRLDPWKLAALVLVIACVDEAVRPGVAHAPGLEVAVPSSADHETQPADDAAHRLHEPVDAPREE
jgi:hypothetical protein